MKPEPRNPTVRFTGLAEAYAKYRPSYPAEAIDAIIGHCGLKCDSLLVDVGCGTGISSRLFAARGIPVLGIEPNQEMREMAETEPWGEPCQPPMYQAGQAEATGLASGIAELVLSAQAFHWFQPDKALSEFHRILRSEGWVGLVWNERDERDAFTAAYGQVIRTAPE